MRLKNIQIKHLSALCMQQNVMYFIFLSPAWMKVGHCASLCWRLTWHLSWTSLYECLWLLSLSYVTFNAKLTLCEMSLTFSKTFHEHTKIKETITLYVSTSDVMLLYGDTGCSKTIIMKSKWNLRSESWHPHDASSTRPLLLTFTLRSTPYKLRERKVHWLYFYLTSFGILRLKKSLFAHCLVNTCTLCSSFQYYYILQL